MAQNSRYARGPRRRVQKVVSVASQAISNAQVDTEVHSCEDTETLVRFIMSGEIQDLVPAARIGLLLQRAPQGVANAVPLVGESLRATPGHDWMWHDCRLTDVVMATSTRRVFEDLSSMRKLQKGDKLILSSLSNVAVCANLFVTCTMFFKE